MPIIKPSQYECDKMKIGDMVFVNKPTFLYSWFRRHFFKSLPKIKVVKSWQEPNEYVEYYQEDCVLVQAWELQCIQTYENEVPYKLSLNPTDPGFSTKFLKTFKVGLYNTQLTFKNNLTLTIPTEFFDRAIRANQLQLKAIDDNRIIQESLKFQRYKGYHFKQQVENRNITEWIPSYCSVCGEPVIFKFNDDKVVIENRCNCGVLKLNMSELTYDELAVWFTNQINPDIKRIYTDFWFNKETNKVEQ